MAWGTPASALGRYEWKKLTAATGWQVCRRGVGVYRSS